MVGFNLPRPLAIKCSSLSPFSSISQIFLPPPLDFFPGCCLGFIASTPPFSNTNGLSLWLLTLGLLLEVFSWMAVWLWVVTAEEGRGLSSHCGQVPRLAAGL